MSATNRKKSNRAELNKLGKKQAHTKQVKQTKTGKITKPKSLKKKPSTRVEKGHALSPTTTPDANVTIKPRAVKIKPAA